MSYPGEVHNIFSKNKKLKDLAFQGSYLYQYRPLNENTYNQILEGYLWADSPDKFNDILDCTTFHAFIGKIYRKIGGKWREKDSKNKIQIIDGLKRSLLISCLTSDNHNITMWSHYAERNEGICLKYDVESIKQDIFKVKYLEDIDKFSKFYELVKNELQEKFDAVFTTLMALMKLSTWSYEKEYRYISLERINPFDPDKQWNGKKINNVKLIGICFGPKTSSTQISLIKKLVEGKDIKLEKLEVKASVRKLEIKSSPFSDDKK